MATALFGILLVSEGVAKTKLFASNMAATLEKSIKPAFEKEMVQQTFRGIRDERWLYDARFMQKQMDFYLIELLEDQQLDKVLDHIENPKEFYAEVLHRLIGEKIVNVDDEWRSFINHLTQSITKAAAVQVDKGRAQTFVDQLRRELLDGYLQSETLGSAFSIDCSDEYEDCDNEDPKEFQDVCLTKLMQVMDKQAPIKDEKNYAKELSPKVVKYMITLNDKAALPRCDECCQLCNSLCLESANHDTKEKPHDAIHQPGGVAGQYYIDSDKLVTTTCSQFYEKDHTFYLGSDDPVKHKYRDFGTVFPGWKDPRINEELPLREYILATYNEEIAKKYKVKPANDIPASYFRDLSSIKEQLERDIANNPIYNSKIQLKSARDVIQRMLADQSEDRISSDVVHQLEGSQSDQHKFFTLLKAPTYPSEEEIQNLIDKGVDVNCVDENGLTPLFYLIQNKSNASDNGLGLLRLLIGNGIDVNSKNHRSENVLDLVTGIFCQIDYLLKDEIVILLIRHGIQLSYQNYEMLKKSGIEDRNGGLEILKYMAKEDLTLGWHKNCNSCENILSIEENARRKVQHHQMFGNTYVAFHMILKDLQAWDKSAETDQDDPKTTERLLEKAQNHFTDPEDKKYLETMIEISEQMIGEDSSLFQCNQYEHYMRSLHRVAGVIGAKISQKQIEFFYLLPFDNPLSYPIDKMNDIEFKIALGEWDKTLFSWMHKAGDDYFGKTLKKDSKKGLFSQVNCSLNCHGKETEKM